MKREIGHSTRMVKPLSFGMVEATGSERSMAIPKVECERCGSSEILINHATSYFALCRRCGNCWKLSEAGRAVK